MGEDSDDRRVSPQLTSPRWLAPGPAPSFERPSSERKNHRSAEKCSTDLKVKGATTIHPRPVPTFTSISMRRLGPSVLARPNSNNLTCCQDRRSP